MFQLRKFAGIISVLIIGFALRMSNYITKPFDEQEANYLWLSLNKPFNVANYLTKFWSEIFGNNITSLRASNLVIYAATFIIVYLCIDKITKNRTITILTSLIYAINPALVVLDQSIGVEVYFRFFAFVIFYISTFEFNIFRMVLFFILTLLASSISPVFIAITIIGLLYNYIFILNKTANRKFILFLTSIILGSILVLIFRSYPANFNLNSQYFFIPTINSTDQFIQILKFVILDISIILVILGIKFEADVNRFRLLFIPLMLFVGDIISRWFNYYPFYGILNILFGMVIAISLMGLVRYNRVIAIVLSQLLVIAMLLTPFYNSNSGIINQSQQLTATVNKLNSSYYVHNNSFETLPIITTNKSSFKKEIKHYDFVYSLNKNENIIKTINTNAFISTNNEVSILDQFQEFIFVYRTIDDKALDFIKSQNYCMIESEQAMSITFEKYSRCSEKI